MNNNVTHIYAFVADGEDGFVSVQIGAEHFPMVLTARKPETLERMKREAAQIARISGKTIRLLKFTSVEELEAFTPRHTKETN